MTRLQGSRKEIPWEIVTISTDGRILARNPESRAEITAEQEAGNAG